MSVCYVKFVSFSVPVSAYQSVYSCLPFSLCPFVPLCLSARLSVCLLACLCLCASICLSACVHKWQTICQALEILCAPHMFAMTPVHAKSSLRVCMYIYIYGNFSTACQKTDETRERHEALQEDMYNIYIYLSLSLSTYLSIYLSLSLSLYIVYIVCGCNSICRRPPHRTSFISAPPKLLLGVRHVSASAYFNRYLFYHLFLMTGTQSIYEWQRLDRFST